MAKKVIFGLGVVIIGILGLLNGLDLFEFTLSFNKCWPIIIILVAIAGFIDSKSFDFWSSALLIIGWYFLLKNFDIIDVSFSKLVFPILLILLGINIIFPTHKEKEIVKVTKDTKNDVSLCAIFGGAESRSQSKDLRKADVNAIFGGATLDLREASSKEGKCVCSSVVAFGGVDIILGEDWIVNTDGVTCIFGGVENKVKNKDAKNILYLTGVVAFGSIDVKINK